MTLDVKGGLKNTSISSNKYVVVEELLSNSIDSYLIRKNFETDIPPLSIRLEVAFLRSNLFESDSYDLEITCIDNGAGFRDDQIRAFVTKDTSYKDYLNIQGVGKCKGAGRIQFFHYFKNLKIDSKYSEQGLDKYCFVRANENTREISEDHFKVLEESHGVSETKVKLYGLKEEAFQKHFNVNAIRQDFSAKTIRNYIFVAFLQRFIVLKGVVGDFSIEIVEFNGAQEEPITEYIKSSDLPDPIEEKYFSVSCAHGNDRNDKKDILKITRYSLPKDRFPSSQHEVALCANSALVLSITKNFLRRPYERSRAINDKFELLLIEGDVLEDKVNEQRDGFNIPKECSANDDIDAEISLQDVSDSIEEYVFSILTPSDFDKDGLINATQERFGISRGMLSEANIKVHYGDTEENIARRVLKKYQDDIVKETSDIFDLKQELLQLDPSGRDFRERVGELSWKYTTTIKKMDMANLSQLVVRRSSILEVLKLSVRSLLRCQNESAGRKENEKVIHNIFFPTGKDSDDGVDHDIWLLNEEYHYFEHIASDKPLSSIPWNEKEMLFDEDVDSDLEDLFKRNNERHYLKRPDIAIFNQEGAAIIVEFKAPGVELQDHIPDLVQYARLLCAKSHGKIVKIYGYLIGDCMDETRMYPGYTKFPSGMGYFSTDPITDPDTRIQYGELYSEVLFYDQFIDRAEKRLKVYKDKINIKM